MGPIVDTQPSDSNPSVEYVIRRGNDSTLYCSCPAWRFQKGRSSGVRVCKHVNRYLARLASDRSAAPIVKATAAAQASRAATVAARPARGPADVRNARDAGTLAIQLATAVLSAARPQATIQAPTVEAVKATTPKARKGGRKVKGDKLGNRGVLEIF